MSARLSRAARKKRLASVALTRVELVSLIQHGAKTLTGKPKLMARKMATQIGWHIAREHMRLIADNAWRKHNGSVPTYKAPRSERQHKRRQRVLNTKQRASGVHGVVVVVNQVNDGAATRG